MCEARDPLFHPAGVHHAEEPSQQEWDRVMHEIDQAFSSVGCAFLTGHGVPDHLVRMCYALRLTEDDQCFVFKGHSNLHLRS